VVLWLVQIIGAGCRGPLPSCPTCTDAQPALQALSMHRDAAQEGHAEAHDAVLASLQCMQALTSGGGGMDAAIAAPHFVQCLCSVLDPDDQDCSKLVVEMLTKLCLYSADGYCAAIQVPTPLEQALQQVVISQQNPFNQQHEIFLIFVYLFC